MSQFIDLFLHLDKHLDTLVIENGSFSYILLFVIVFCETGLVITPFLPGDSLLFAAGAIAARGSLDIAALIILLFVASVLGDTVNYWVGKKIGPKVFERNYWFIKRSYLERTQKFFEKYGSKAIVIARFVPIIRTFAPFLAGVGTMNYKRFAIFNITGGALWCVGFLGGGYLFGNIEVVKHNFSIVVLGIIFVSILPAVVEAIKAWKESRRLQKTY